MAIISIWILSDLISYNYSRFFAINADKQILSIINNQSMTEAYKPYVDYILSGNVAETAYILSHEGAICGTSLPIT